MAPPKKKRHWTRGETLCLLSLWAEPRRQRQFEEMVHNHSIWEDIHAQLLLRHPAVEEFGDWTKIKDRLEYLRRGYRNCLKANKKSGASATTCPYFEELDAVLGKNFVTFPSYFLFNTFSRWAGWPRKVDRFSFIFYFYWL